MRMTKGVSRTWRTNLILAGTALGALLGWIYPSLTEPGTRILVWAFGGGMSIILILNTVEN